MWSSPLLGAHLNRGAQSTKVAGAPGLRRILTLFLLGMTSHNYRDVDGCEAPGIGSGMLMWPCCNTTCNQCGGTNQQWLLNPKTNQLVTAMDPTLCLSAPSMRLAVCDASMPAQKWQYNEQAGTITNALVGPAHCLSTAPVPPSPPPPPEPALNNHSVAVQINGACNSHKHNFISDCSLCLPPPSLLYRYKCGSISNFIF